jgi:hypothetical protein
MQETCPAFVIFNILNMLPVSNPKALSRLTYVYAWAILAFEPIDPTIIISAIV